MDVFRTAVQEIFATGQNWHKTCLTDIDCPICRAEAAGFALQAATTGKTPKGLLQVHRYRDILKKRRTPLHFTARPAEADRR